MSGRRGRPPSPDGPTKRHGFGFRTTKRIKDMIEQAVEQSGRSAAQEIEMRLEKSFYDSQLAGLAARIAELEAEREALRERLELTHVWIGSEGGPAKRVPLPAGMHIPDGIECRDETIRLQEERIAGLEAERDRLNRVIDEMPVIDDAIRDAALVVAYKRIAELEAGLRRISEMVTDFDVAEYIAKALSDGKQDEQAEV